MLESEADRLATVQALGSGAKLKSSAGSFAVIFDAEYLLAGEVEERAPVATMTAEQVASAALQKDVVVEVFNPLDGSRKDYRVKRLEPDGTGITLVVLKAA